VLRSREAPLAAAEFEPGTGVTYLNHAAAGLLPRRTRDALVTMLDGQMREGVLGIVPVESHLDALRARIGRFIGASGHEIAFLRNTGDGANTIARGLDWQPGDQIVLTDNEFGANALPWLAAREAGAEIVYVRAPRERMTPDVLRAKMTPRTRVVAVSWVSFGDGYRHDLAALAEVAHAGGGLFCVDAIQALGAFPLDVKACGIDALYAGGAKWLLAMPGASFLYVDEALIERLAVRWRGWRDVEDIWNFLDYEQALAPGAARFEGGTQNFIGIRAIATSMDVLDEASAESIGSHVLALTDALVEGLHVRGASVASDRTANAASGIVTFALPATDSVELGRALGRRGIITTFRPTGVRVSPHGYNAYADIERFFAALDDARASAVQ
jgi:selenocysteine lyase/cysteine desulfurase